MLHAQEIAGDLAAAATALAGLMLVFMGAVSTAFDAYSTEQQDAVRSRYRWRIWLAFAGFLTSLASATLALVGKWQECPSLVRDSLYILLLGAFVIAVIAALLTAKDIG
jgi:hypothetical protein